MSNRKLDNPPKITTAVVGHFSVRFFGLVPCPHCGHHANAADVQEHQDGGARLVCQQCHRNVFDIEHD
jgi:transcription elongation factor Elf1